MATAAGENIVKLRSGNMFVFVFAASLFFAGCAAVGPDYVSPETAVSSAWYTPLDQGLTSEEMDPAALASWWTTLNDPILTSLIERAVAGNLDLKEAQARVRESRVQRGLADTDLFPTLSMTASGSRSRGSERTGGGTTRESYSVNFDAGWEVDIFGGVRRSIEAAEADLQSSVESLRDTLVSLLAETALNYVEARTYQERVAVAQANLTAQEETYELTRIRYEAGLSDELAVQQARYNLENTRSQIPSLRSGLDQAMNRLAVLLGEQVSTIHKELDEPKPIPVTPLTVAVGIPADILRRRPDVRKAERDLASQTANIGATKANLYPKLSLGGSIGLESLQLGDLISTKSDSWSFGPRISWSIFDAGAIRRNVEVQTIRQEQALIRYESTVLSALEEVENALTAYAEEQLRRESLKAAALAAEKAVELSQDKYQAGLKDFSEVLDAQRSQLSYQDQLAQSEGNVTSNLLRLYKALGGGWTSLAPEKGVE